VDRNRRTDGTVHTEQIQRNKGYNDGAGNPPNPLGLKTDYLWKEVLTPAGLTNILENYEQIVEEKDPRTGKKKRKQVWPRYQQLGVVRQALADVRAHGAGTVSCTSPEIICLWAA